MIEVWFDGVCEPTNPNGYGAYGFYITNNGKETFKKGVFLGQGEGVSNNVAEYSGFIHALEFLKNKNLCNAHIIIRGDSKLVIEQMSGNWKINRGLYVFLAFRAKKLLKEFKNIRLLWIPREENEICDKLAKDILLDIWGKAV